MDEYPEASASASKEERGKHLGAAQLRGFVRNGARQPGFPSCGQWFRGKFRIVVVEGQDAEAIVRAEPVEDLESASRALA